MLRCTSIGWMLVLAVGLTGMGRAATEVPTDIQQPGTQPGEVGALETPDKCDNCHGNRGKGVELAHEWRGSMMAQAGRDPIFWATMAISEQDFDGSGDLCLRCHSTSGWMAGHSTPTDGSGLTSGDADGLDCHFCHSMTNPDDSEFLGVMSPDFVANDGGNPPVGYYGSGMTSIWNGNEKLGPYADAGATHQFAASSFHRSVDFCGTCHDVSNPVVGDLAHNAGAQDGAPSVVASGSLGGSVTGKAAFNNFPYQYGVVERTFSEYKAGALVQKRVSDYLTLPLELQAGAIQEAYNAALVAGTGGDYEDGTPRYFSCQTCHMRPTTGVGCDKNGVPIRADLPLHDLVGGNYWMPRAIAYLDSVGKLRLGGGMSTDQTNDMLASIERAEHQLAMAASLTVTDRTVRVTNLTGHKLISGYPEGRRMWLRVEWYDDQDELIGVTGEYGPLSDDNGQPVVVTNPADGQPVQVESILDLSGQHTKIYEAHYGVTQEWAAQLIGLGYPAGMVVGFDRLTGAVAHTLGELAAEPAGTSYESFHFVLNNKVLKDNRIPTWGMRYDDSRVRNTLPVPSTQYGAPEAGGVYQHWDEVTFTPPTTLAVRGEVELLYQTTSWEYIQFLHLANDGSVPFLANEGINMLEAWVNEGMSEPAEMASATIVVPEPAKVSMLIAGLMLLGLLGRWRSTSRLSPALSHLERD
jgi:hypothetical protein